MEILDDEILLTEKELLFSVWMKPRLTFQYIFRYCPEKYVTLFLILSGIVNGIERSYRHVSNQTSYTILFFLVVLFFAGIFGVIFGRFYAALLGFTGRWIKGIASSDQLIAVVAWSSIPTICAVLLLIPKVLIFGNEPFSIDFQEQSPIVIISYFIIIAIQLVLSVWSIVILVQGVSLAQNFSIKKAILNVLFSVLIIVVPVLLIMGLFFMFR